MQADDLKHFESKLRRSLMPVALSDDASGSIHAMLDELAGMNTANADAPPAPAAIAPKNSSWRAAAAVVAGLLAISAWLLAPGTKKLAFSPSPKSTSFTAQNVPIMHLVDESTHLAWFEDEGWLDDPDGGALRAVRMRVVEENRFLDAETGLIVHVSSPREEMLLMPVSSF